MVLRARLDAPEKMSVVSPSYPSLCRPSRRNTPNCFLAGAVFREAADVLVSSLLDGDLSRRRCASQQA
jgi:hypothetical protein